MHSAPIKASTGHALQFSTKLTPLWALVAVLCASPLFFLFAVEGNPGRGRAAMLCAAVIMIAIRSRWDLSRHFWFWITITIIAGSHLALVLFTPWPQGLYPGFTLLLPAALDFALIYGLLKIVERTVQRRVIDNS